MNRRRIKRDGEKTWGVEKRKVFEYEKEGRRSKEK